MRLALVTAPAPLVTREEAKAHLKVEGEGEDTLIDGYVLAATRSAEQHTGRVFMPQTWDLWLDQFPWEPEGLALPLRPVIQIDQAKLLTTDGSEIDWPVNQFGLYGIGAPTGYLRPYATYGWPALLAQPDAARIQFTAGYADLAHPDLDVARSAVLLATHDLYANRSAQEIAPGTSRVANETFARLLAPLRVYV